MNSYDIIGYAYEGEIYCPDCIEDDEDDPELSPIFCDNSESDCPDHCCQCHVPLRNSLTSDGVDYVLDQIIEDFRHAKEWDSIVDDRLPYYKGSRWVDIVRDWARQISDYSLTPRDKFIVDLFLDLSEPLDKVPDKLWAEGATDGMEAEA